jgi:hypothetical protein
MRGLLIILAVTAVVARAADKRDEPEVGRFREGASATACCIACCIACLFFSLSQCLSRSMLHCLNIIIICSLAPAESEASLTAISASS